jgi:hypothetical protein
MCELLERSFVFTLYRTPEFADIFPCRRPPVAGWWKLMFPRTPFPIQPQHPAFDLEPGFSPVGHGMAISEYHEQGMFLPTKVVTRKPFHLVIPLTR